MKQEFLELFTEKEKKIIDLFTKKLETTEILMQSKIMELQDKEKSILPEIYLTELIKEGYMITDVPENPEQYMIIKKIPLTINSYYMRKRIYKIPEEIVYNLNIYIRFKFNKENEYLSTTILTENFEKIVLFHTSNNNTCYGDEPEPFKLKPTIEELNETIKKFQELMAIVNLTSPYCFTINEKTAKIYEFIREKFKKEKLGYWHADQEQIDIALGRTIEENENEEEYLLGNEPEYEDEN